MPPPPPSSFLSTGHLVRQASRARTLEIPTSGLAPTYIQANLLVLPSRYAQDFRQLCFRNPVPCPLIGESSSKGDYASLKSYLTTAGGMAKVLIGNEDEGGEGEEEEGKGKGRLDLRRDLPRYIVYRDGKKLEESGQEEGILDLENWWTEDHIAFLIGCSFSFETGLKDAGLTPRHMLQGRNVPMYRTNNPLCSAGVFVGSTYVVSMRPYRMSELERVRDITRRYGITHGEPIAWGWEAVGKLGIMNLNAPEWGDAPVTMEGKKFEKEEGEDGCVPVFWGCGVTTQEAVVRAGLEGIVMAHAPGHMLVLDCQDKDVMT